MQTDDEPTTTHVLSQLSSAFLIGAQAHGAPKQTWLDGKLAQIIWLPVELTRNDPQEQAPATLAIDEMNARVGNCLAAIFAEEPGGIRRCEYEGSNDPLISAGLMLTGDLDCPLRRFPATFPEDRAAVERFKENLVQYTEFFLTLVRVAQRAGHRSTLMSRLLRLFVTFSDEHRADLARWRKLETGHYENGTYCLSAEELIASGEYIAIDEAGEEFSDHLLAVVDGLEHEIAPMINSFPPSLAHSQQPAAPPHPGTRRLAVTRSVDAIGTRRSSLRGSPS